MYTLRCEKLFQVLNVPHLKGVAHLVYFTFKNQKSHFTFAKSAVNLFISVSETSPEVTTNLKRKVVD